MPIIPLKNVRYDHEIQQMVDVLNENFRYLDWLLNNARLDGTNINQTTITIEMSNPEMENPVVDPYGINPEYIKFYPNQCYNSSFEIHSGGVPDYWETDGEVVAEDAFDGEHSLKLAAGQYAVQAEINAEGLADPSKWWWTPDTRIAFRAKGSGTVRVTVTQGGVTQALWVWVADSRGNMRKQTYQAINFGVAADWPVGLRTFAVQPSGAGKITLRFDNVGTGDVYLDAVTIEADWTRRWSSVYTHGPRSQAAMAGDEYIEYGDVAWNEAGMEITLTNLYEFEPKITCGINGLPADFVNAAFVLVIQHDIETVDGVDYYSKVKITPKGTAVPTVTSGTKVPFMAVCRGAKMRPAPGGGA